MEEEIEVEKKALENQDDLVEALKKAKEDSVPKEKYLKLKEENKRLINAFANGEEMPGKKEEERIPTEQLRKNLLEAKTNLDYAKASLALRDRNLEENGVDDYLPNSSTYNPTQQDKESAERTAEVLRQCIEESNGNPKVFAALFDSRLEDIALPRKK